MIPQDDPNAPLLGEVPYISPLGPLSAFISLQSCLWPQQFLAVSGKTQPSMFPTPPSVSQGQRRHSRTGNPLGGHVSSPWGTGFCFPLHCLRMQPSPLAFSGVLALSQSAVEGEGTASFLWEDWRFD